jgi:HK97 family phage prohead protease
MVADFSGWATKAGLKCTDGRTIMPGAFAHQDGLKVPLVWQHGHNDPENVLGHVLLTNKEEGVWCEGFFNDSPKAKHSHGLLEHGDINMLSIWANQLVEKLGKVMHGMIREVSLVLAGANSGATIENVTIRHSDGETTELEDEAIIFTGLPLEHADGDDDGGSDDGEGDGKTVEDIVETMNEEQQNVLHYLVGKALSTTPPSDEGDAEHSDNKNKDTDTDNQEGKQMKHNVFEDGDKGGKASAVLSHADVQSIFQAAQKCGSLKEAFEVHALAHGITDIEALFPEATQLTNAPEFFTRRMEWVQGVLSGARKTPFSRVRSATADLTFDDARARGYIKGNLKKEQFFTTSRRTTTPQTIYKKQKLDRDDMIDITDFDVVAWLKVEMRFMLEEELARAVLIGDGREADDDDKIQETNIRPIATDDEFYTIRVNVNLDDASSSYMEFLDELILQRSSYRGSNPTFYTTEAVIAQLLLLRDEANSNRRLYNTVADLAAAMRVNAVVAVEVMETVPDLVGVLVNMADYVIGADKGGQTAMFDDFDIDYNQYKYLIETRVSGALVRPKTAMAFYRTAEDSELVVPTAPSFDGEDITIPTVTGVTYRDADDDAVTGTVAVANGTTVTIHATPDTGYHFASSEGDTWSFTNPL